MANLSHELLGGEDQLVVDEPAGLLLKQRAVGVHVNSLLVLHSLVASFAQSGRVIEISCSHRLQEGEDKRQRRADGLIKRDSWLCREEQQEKYRSAGHKKNNVRI